MRRLAVISALALALLAAPPAHAQREPPGPALLRAPPVDAPQLQSSGVWRAPPILVSGTEAYRDGEYLYQDFLYDDLGAANAPTYPPLPQYAGNAADLVELRLRPLEGETAIRLTYNSMLDPALVGTTIGLGGGGAPAAMPYGAGARMPARVFLTVAAGRADAVDAASGTTLAAGLPVAVDLVRRQVDVRLPYAVFDPRGHRAVRVGAATGLWDPVAGAYVAQPGGAAFLNVAFRFDEPAAVPGGGFRSTRQAEALRAGDLSAFAARVDFAKLAVGVRDDSAVPRTGFLNRIFASATEERQGRGDLESHSRGCDPPCALQYSGRLQPYSLYVPARPAPPGGFGLTLDLHGCGSSHNLGYDSPRQRQLGERGRGHVVLSPLGRGDCYWFYGPSGADVFEAWADVARNYPLDRRRTAATGISMGGYGALKLAAAYPDLFARAAVVAPCPSAGIQWAPGGVPPGGRASRLTVLLPALRQLPVMSWQTRTDAACVHDGPGRAGDVVERFDDRGHPFEAWTFSGPSHKQMASQALAQSGPLADFLGDARTGRDPARVTYTANVLLDEPQYGLPADRAWWLSGVRISRAHLRVGTVDATTRGLGRAPDLPAPVTEASGVLEGGPLGPLPYASRGRPVRGERAAPRRDRLDVVARNVAEVTVDTARAGLTCDAAVRGRIDLGPLLVHLRGCATTWTLKDVCHATPVFDVVLRAPRGERQRSAGVTVRGRSLRVRGRRVRVDLRRDGDAVARARVVSVDAAGRRRVRATAHRWCPGRG